MATASILRVFVLCGAICFAHGATSRSEEPAVDGIAEASAEQTPAVRLTVAAARERAQLMHQIYTATLDAMHHYYFHANKAVIPARAMEDVFAEVAHASQTTARWIAVNTKAMSIDHEPETEFEKAAAAELAAGKPAFESVEGDTFRRATPIPLTAGCVGCHTGAFSKPTSLPRVAGLVISIPVQKE
jgi:hypothetical protein